MPNLPQQNTITQYLADGISTNYPVTFFTPIETDGTPDLDVYTQLNTAPAIPAADIKIWNEDYIYTPNLDPITGGTITFLSGRIPPNNFVVTIVRNVSASLDAEFANAQNFSGITLDAALDKLLLISQQNKSYALGRNLSYVVNSYLPISELMANVQIPVLAPGNIWLGSPGGVLSVFLQQPADVSTLRSELANEQNGTDGARLVGYYDSVNNTPTTVDAQLTFLTNAVVAPFPTGSIIDFGGTTAPAGFLMCDGASNLVADQPDLFAVIGYTWGGAGPNFNSPNLEHRVTMGSGGTTTNPTIGTAVGDIGGEDLHTMTLGELVSHDHATIGAFSTTNGSFNTTNTGPNTRPGGTAATTEATGSSTPFNIIQRSAIVMKIIKT